jgi:hypothetical protein
MLQMWKFHRNMWGWHWGKNVDMSQYFHAVYHASISHTFATPLTHSFPMSCYRFVTYSPWYESSKAWQQWGKSMGKMWKTTPNVVVGPTLPLASIQREYKNTPTICRCLWILITWIHRPNSSLQSDCRLGSLLDLGDGIRRDSKLLAS